MLRSSAPLTRPHSRSSPPRTHFRVRPPARLQAAIRYDTDELLETKALIEQCPPDEADTIVNDACILYKEGLGVDGSPPQPERIEQARL